MKKKTPFLLVLAALSVSAMGLGAAGCGDPGNSDGGADEHKHEYYAQWTRTDDAHYFAASCGHDDKKDYGVHDTDGNGGACSVCGYASYTITYVTEHGEAPAALQKQTKLPETLPVLSVSGYDFGGWYLDAACSEDKKAVAGAALSGATSLYAKWTEKEVEVGSSADNPVVLQALGAPVLTTLINGKVYFKYTAAAAGRYTVSVVALGEVTEVVSDDDSAKIVKEDGVGYHLSLSADKSVIITVSKGNADDTAKVSAVVNECVNEPLPAEGWEAGVYSDLFGVLKVDFGRNGELYFNGSATPSRYSYVGGDINALRFEIGGVQYGVKYSVENGKKIFTLSYSSKTQTLVLEEEQAAIAIAKFSGKYEPSSDAAKVTGIKLINIYDDGTGYYVDGSGAKNKIENVHISFNQKINKLVWGTICVITVNLNAQGEAESIDVANASKQGVYTRTGNSSVKPPETLSLPAVDAEYRGETYSILTTADAQYYKGLITVNIDDFDGEYYIVIYKSAKYKLKLVKTGEEVTAIEWYDLEGNKLDTLNKVVLNLHDLLSSEESSQISSSDFENGAYFFKALEAGIYKITATAVDADYTDVPVAIVYNVKAYDINKTGDSLPASGVVQLEAGAIVKLSCDVAFETVTFACRLLDDGMSESNPIVINDGSGEVVGLVSNQNYYFTYTAPEAGKYTVLCNTIGYGSAQYNLRFKVGDADYGFDFDSYEWLGDTSNVKPYAIIDVPADNLTVKVCVLIDYADQDGSLFVKISKAATQNYTALEFDEEYKGELASGGSFHYVDDVPDAYENVVLSCDSSMTVTVSGTGEVKTGVEISLSKRELGFGFTLESAGKVGYALIARRGSDIDPYKINALGVTPIQNVQNADWTNDCYAVITAPSDKNILITLGQVDGEYFGFSYEKSDGNSGDVAAKKALAIAAGESVTICISDLEGELDVIIGVDYSVNAEALALVNGTPAENKLISSAECAIGGEKVIKIEDTYGVDVVVTASCAFSLDYGISLENAVEKDGVYSLTITAGANIAFKVTAEGTLTFSATYNRGHVKYPCELAFENGKFTATVSKSTSYVFAADGNYLFTYKGCELRLNGKSISSGAIVVSAGDVLTVAPYRNNGEFSIAIAVPAQFKGKYTYGSDVALKITANHVITDGKDYVLTAISGDVYTFTYAPADGTSETVALTLNATERKIGDQALTFVPLFSEAQSVEYVFEDRYVTYSLTLNANGTGVYSIDYGNRGKDSRNVDVEEGEGKFVFSIGTAEYSFTFDADGNVVLVGSYDNEFTLYAPGNVPEPETPSGLVYSGDGITITIPDGAIGNFVSAVITIDGESYNITIYENVSYYEYDDGEESPLISGTFTVSADGNTITMTDDWGTYTLTKQ